jgi:hypothetical protein
VVCGRSVLLPTPLKALSEAGFDLRYSSVG